jgi:hypothetical protein
MDYERLSQSLAGLHYFAFAILMLADLARLLAQNSQQALMRRNG